MTQPSHNVVSSIDIIKKSSKEFGFNLPKTSMKKACEAMENFLIEKFGADNVEPCPTCKYSFPETYKVVDDNEEKILIDNCPYCGTRLEYLDDNEEAVEETIDEDELEDGFESEEEIKAKEAKEEAKEVTADAEKVARKRGRPKGSTSKTQTEKTVSKINKKLKKVKKITKPVKKNMAISKDLEDQLEISPEREAKLDKHIESIKELSKNMGRGHYLIGKELNVIRDERLWEGYGYKSMQDFVENKLDMSRQLAQKYMKTSGPQGLEEKDCMQIGIKKADLVMSVPTEFRDKVLTAAKKKTFTELSKYKNRLLGKSTYIKEDDGVPKVTLITRLQQGQINVPWISVDTGEQIKVDDDDEYYAVLQITENTEIKFKPNEFGTGLIAVFQKCSKKDKESSKEEAIEDRSINLFEEDSLKEEVVLESESEEQPEETEEEIIETESEEDGSEMENFDETEKEVSELRV